MIGLVIISTVIFEAVNGRFDHSTAPAVVTEQITPLEPPLQPEETNNLGDNDQPDSNLVDLSHLSLGSQTVIAKLNLTPAALAAIAKINFELIDPDDLKHKCRWSNKPGDIHGCYHSSLFGEAIYVVDSHCPGLTESTAAHEILHALYNQMNADRKTIVNGEIEVFAAINPGIAADLLHPYATISQTTKIDELHSFLAHTQANLPNKLNTHYSLYFKDNRQSILGFETAYHQYIIDHHAQIKDLKDRIKAEEVTISHIRTQIDLATNHPNLVNIDEPIEILHERLADQIEATNQAIDHHNQLSETVREINKGRCQQPPSF